METQGTAKANGPTYIKVHKMIIAHCVTVLWGLITCGMHTTFGKHVFSSIMQTASK